MKILDIKKTNEQIIYKCEVDSKEWTQQLEKTKNGMLKNIKVDGFRKGKVPAEIAEKHLDKLKLINTAFSKIIDSQLKALEESKEYKKEDAEVYPQVDLGMDTIDLERLIIEFKYWIIPTVTIKDYKSFVLPERDIEVKDEEIEKEIKYLVNSKKVITEKTEGKLEKTDIAIFDFIGYKDGEKFSGGEAKNYELEIGSNQFIPGFEDQMVGMKLNETKKLKLKFPKDYHATDLADKDVEFDVTLNGMKKVEIPKIDEKFFESFSTLKEKGIKTKKDVEKYIKELLVESKKQQYLEQATPIIYNGVFENTTISYIPSPIVDKEFEKEYDAYEKKLTSQGVKIKDYLQYTQQSIEDFKKQFRQQVEKSFVTGLALEEIAKKEKIEIDEKQIMSYIEDVCKIYGGDPKEIRKSIGDNTNHVESILLNKRVIERLIDLNISNKPKNQEKKVDSKSTEEKKEDTKSNCKKSTCKSKKQEK